MNNRLKSILPTLRERKRYLVFEIVSDCKEFDFSVISREFMHAMFDFIGTKGMAQAGFFLLADKYENNTGIIRINHEYTQHTKAALAMISVLNNQQAFVHTIGVSGTIHSLEKKYKK